MTKNTLLVLALLPLLATSAGCSKSNDVSNTTKKQTPTLPDDGTDGNNKGNKGSSSGEPTDMTPTDMTPTDMKPVQSKPLPPDAFPRAMLQGGPVVKKPKVQVITFKGDTLAPQIEDFSKKMDTSTYWAAMAAEYGIGNLTSKTPIRLNESAPANLSLEDINTFLQKKLDGTDPKFGTPDSDTVYALYYPSGTVINDAQLGKSCQYYLGFHFETAVGSTKIGYAVMPRCHGSPGQTDVDVLTETASHEYFEWASDPFPESDTAWSGVDDDHYMFEKLFLGELGDLCVLPGVPTIKPGDLGYIVQRQWSNKASQAGHAPCVPSDPKQPYFQAIPTLTDEVSFRDPQTNRTRQSKGLIVPVGQSKTMDVLIYSDLPMSTPITVSALDVAQNFKGTDPEFECTLDKTTVLPGDTVKVTVKALTAATQGQGVVLVAKTSKANVNVWPVLVSNR